jgi:acetyltransferase-like isoleucine patch superfamily enzyme
LGVSIGDGCRLLISNFGTEPWLIRIGDRVTISHGVLLLTHDGAPWLVRDDRGRRYRYARIEIGNDVFIGANSIIMPGIRIGNRAIVGAGSVVTRSVPSGTVVAGNPARILGEFNQYVASGLNLPSASDMTGVTLRKQIDSIVDPGFRPELTSRTAAVGESA